MDPPEPRLLQPHYATQQGGQHHKMVYPAQPECSLSPLFPLGVLYNKLSREPLGGVRGILLVRMNFRLQALVKGFYLLNVFVCM
jgi:hypothetical protein